MGTTFFDLYLAWVDFCFKVGLTARSNTRMVCWLAWASYTASVEMRSIDPIIHQRHSTGGLVASLYGGPQGGGWRGAIDGYIFNSPFWSWNVSWYEKMVVTQTRLGMEAGIRPETLISEGGGVSGYASGLHKTYGFPTQLKSLKNLQISAGWCNAVTEAWVLLFCVLACVYIA